MKKIILYAAIIETVYLSLSFILALQFGQWSFEGEIVRTGLRFIPIVIFGYLYQKYFYDENRTINARELTNPNFIAAVSLLMFFAMAYTNAKNESLIWQSVFAVSGITAGLREELLYRGIIQSSLQKRFGQQGALVLTTFIFVLSHVQYFFYGQFHGLLLITIAGIIFGSIFLMTGSVVVTSLIHGLYDAVLCMDLIPFRLSNEIALPILFSIMLVFLIINKKVFRTEESKSTETSPV